LTTIFLIILSLHSSYTAADQPSNPYTQQQNFSIENLIFFFFYGRGKAKVSAHVSGQLKQ